MENISHIKLFIYQGQINNYHRTKMPNDNSNIQTLTYKQLNINITFIIETETFKR